MNRRASLRVALVALSAAALWLGFAPIGAQAPPDGDHAAHLKAWDAHKAMTQSSPYRAMNWSFLGPTNISGRIADVAVADRGSSRRLYAGSCCGGVWASDDLGQTWQAVFEKEASTAIGALAVAPSNPDILWVGTGESNIFRSSYTGVGVYKSTDNAKSFQHMGLTDTGTRINLVHRYQTGYADSGDLGSALSRFTSKGDGAADEVHGLRDQYGADVAILLTGSGNYCGVAWLYPGAESAFGVVAQNCATGYYSFAHEIGHNLGLLHAPTGATTTSRSAGARSCPTTAPAAAPA